MIVFVQFIESATFTEYNCKISVLSRESIIYTISVMDIP